MNEQIQQARRYVRMVWPYRWAALGLSVLVCIGGWIFALMMPDIYEVKAKIFVDTRSMLRPLLKGLAIDSESLASSANMMKRTLMTRPNLEQVARKTDLDLKTKTDREFDAVISGLAEKISLQGTQQDNIYEIAFTGSDPKQAKRVVDELLNTFMEAALGSNRKDTAVTQKFLDEQIVQYEQRLLDAEGRLKEFKQRNVGVMPGEGSSYFRNLQNAREMLQRAQLELHEAQNRSSTLRQKLEGEEPVLGVMGDQQSLRAPAASRYDGRLAHLQEQMDQLLLQYTDKHPDIQAIREQMEGLKARRDEELKELAAKAANEPQDSLSMDEPAEGGVYQEIKLAMAEADAEVAGLTARVNAYQAKVTELEHQVDSIPEIEAELKRLDRDYGLNKQQYDELLKRRESARLSQEVDQQADDVKLKVIDPPRVPLLPIGPNRVQVMTMVLLAALGAGVGLAFLLSQINPRFYSSEELKEITQLPVLGTVSLVFSERQRTERRMELGVFALTLIGLFAVYGALVTLESMHVNLSSHISRLIEAKS
ncbi:MAG: chain-length determining protein [Gammaproteobacteria bacterium]|nr:chain-length determining protein [Gammaproteobacteria bacterium]